MRAAGISNADVRARHVSGDGATSISLPGRDANRFFALDGPGWPKSHAELDEATELGDDDPRLLAAAHERLTPLLPPLPILGGCCGTDARHVAALWNSP
jgi:hypothetical protein